MSLPHKHPISLEEFYKRREQHEQVCEYIDGIVYMSPSPSTAHQRIQGRLHVQLYHLLEEADCEVFLSPYDIELKKDGIEGKKIVVPDLSVICDKNGLGETRYTGVPTLIVEIVSPSNQAHDLVTKLNLYMQYGVKEYWIVNPILKTVQLYVLNDEENYILKDVAKETGWVKSQLFPEFQVNLKNLFS